MKNEMKTECSSTWCTAIRVANLETELEAKERKISALRAELAEKEMEHGRQINEVWFEQVRYLHRQRDELMGRLYPRGESLEERVEFLERIVAETRAAAGLPPAEVRASSVSGAKYNLILKKN